MVSMNAGQLDGRNIGSNLTLPYSPGGRGDSTISGALALVIQVPSKGKTEITFAHDDEVFEVDSISKVEVNLPPAAAYTLGVKNAVEELLARHKAQ